ncbi:diamine acetyltransferase 2-like [Strongylocentrotus purpuratus]|uniref:N-acetyltransferase domain-containing protein n=1 Tax=Strongylocentrotus purpuratus TaxID=7668 RepID=A0A7M7NK04_STRPU|nr:diamine acetyltransferase 2-like [Strongylocentrotus purpuratus]
MESGKSSKIAGLITTVSQLVLKDKRAIDLGKDQGDKIENCSMSKTMTRYVIRRGQIDDCSQISVLMRELAESEDYGDRVEVSEDDLRRDGFGDNPVFESIVLEDREADEESSILGYALFFMGFCSWKGRLLYLEDVYIDSEYRGTGLGIALLHTIAKISEERGCKAIQGTVVEWNTDVMKLYKRIGATDMTENDKYHLFAIGGTDVSRFAKARIPAFNNGSQIVTCEL